jgi:predicted transposase YbfD/YdcC
LWAETFDEVTTCDKGHGRVEKRTLRTTTALSDYLDWPALAQVGRVEAEVTRDGKTTREVRYFITSVPRSAAKAPQLLAWVRGHWSIENRTHYVRDVTLGEDASRVRQGSGPQVLAAVRNAALGLLRQWGGFETIAEALRRNAARVPELFTKLGIL